MQNLLLSKRFYPERLLRPTVDFILGQQQADGAIPWFRGGILDPWDHVEAAMGLTVGGEYAAARRAYRWLAREQLPDGSWWANYRHGQPVDRDHRETHFVAYIATGLWHYYRITGHREFLEELFPCLSGAMEFVLRYQSPQGEFHWAVTAGGSAKEDALVTACSSIHKSLECAVNIAAALGREAPHWELARQRLLETLRRKPHRFDRTWPSKARFAMDWFYPLLSGTADRYSARQRLKKRWPEFVEPGVGCRCVSDEPWVTVAESCELTLALLAAGDRARALHLFSWLHRFCDSDGGYWTGYNFRDQVLWPLEKTTWTAAAVLLAADALTGHTPAANLFTQSCDADTLTVSPPRFADP